MSFPKWATVTKQPAGHWSWLCAEHGVGSVSAVGDDAEVLRPRIVEHDPRHNHGTVTLW